MADVNIYGISVSTTGQEIPLGPVDIITNGATGSNLILSNTGLGGFTGLRGHTGLQSASQGATGVSPQGVTGLRGITGFSPFGETGLQGATGFIGQTGIAKQGETGIFGHFGVTGVSIVGDTGIQGFTGVVGTTGLTGTGGGTGLQGETGIQGVTGAGLQGATGFRGATGILGATGFIGVTGVAGQGATGFQGVTGTLGVTGLFTYQNLDTVQQTVGVTGLYTIQANTLSADEQQIEFWAWGITANASDTIVSVFFGPYSILERTINVSGGATFMIKGYIIRVSSTVQEATLESIFNNSVSCSVQRFPTTLDLTDPQNLIVSLSSAGAGHVLNGFITNRAT